jgi:hypothetical protein
MRGFKKRWQVCAKEVSTRKNGKGATAERSERWTKEVAKLKLVVRVCQMFCSPRGQCAGVSAGGQGLWGEACAKVCGRQLEATFWAQQPGAATGVLKITSLLRSGKLGLLKSTSDNKIDSRYRVLYDADQLVR